MLSLPGEAAQVAVEADLEKAAAVEAAVEAAQLAAAAEAGSEKAAEKKEPSDQGKVIFAHGMGLTGRIEGATDRTISWMSEFFAEPVDLRFSALRSIEMEVPAKTPIPEHDSMAVILVDGGLFYGNLVTLDTDSIVVDSSRCGLVELALDRVAALRWFRRGDLIWNGPSGSAGISHPDEPPVGRRWLGGPGGEVKSVGWKHRGIVPVDLPDQVEVEFRLRSSKRPEFEVTLLSRKQNAVIKTWDDEVVLRRGDDHLRLLTLDDKDREIALRVFWDQTTDSGTVATLDGTVLGRWQCEGGEPGQRGKEGGVPLLYLAKRELSPQEEPVPDGLAFNNLGRDVTVQGIQVRRWDGKAPRPRTESTSQGTPRVELVDGNSLGIFSGGMVASATPEEVKLSNLSDPIPLSQVESIVFAEHGSIDRTEPKPGTMELRFDDGTRLLAGIRSLEGDRFELSIAGSEAPIKVKKSGLYLAGFHEEIEPAFTDGSFQRGDEVTFEKTSIHGNWVPAKGGQPLWKPPGAEAGVPLAAGKPFELTRNYPEGKPISKAGALVHLKEGQVLPTRVTGIGRNGDWVELDSEYASIKRFEAGEIRAIQFPGAEVNPNHFQDQGWRTVRGKKGQSVVLEKSSEGDASLKKVTLGPGGAWGHASILQGTEIKFNLHTKGYGTLRLRMFGGNTEAGDQDSTRILLAHFGDEIYCGAERTPGDFGMRRDIRAESNKAVPIRISWDAKKLTIYAKEQQAIVVPVTKDYPRNGTSLVFEPADLWGNGEREVIVSDFALKAAPGMISAPPILTEAKERALMIPRFRRDDAPHQVLLAWNGDLLRGSIESATRDAFSFRTGLETHQIPSDRVAAAIWLAPPNNGEDDNEPTSEEAPEEDGNSQAIQIDGAEVVVNGKNLIAMQKVIGGKVEIGAIQAGGVRMNRKGKGKKNTALPLTAADGFHTIRLYNGGELAMKVDSFGPETITGATETLGECRIPASLVGSIRTGKPTGPSASSSAFLGWNLEHAPEPTPTDGQGGDTNSPLVGKDAPPVDLPLLGEGRFKLEKGKVVVLDFWATWCGPCVRAIPEMIESFSRFDSEDFSFVAVNQAEGPGTIEKFLERRGWPNLTVALDAQQSVAGTYGVQGIPHTVIIDKNGKVAWVKTGYQPGAGDEAAEVVEGLLAK